MSEFTVDSFVDECVDTGKISAKDFCNEARSQIAQIDNEISKISELRNRRSVLMDVLRNFDPSYRSKKSGPVINKSISDASSVENNTLLVDICDYIDRATDARNVRTIAEAVGYGNQDPTPVYSMIKILHDTGILKKDESNKWFKGPNWKDRPN